jgi:hypothetical protein
VVTHAPVDLAGLRYRLPARTPPEADQVDSLIDYLRTWPARFGVGGFDLVVSTGLLTQLFSPVVGLGLDPRSLAQLVVAIRGQHLRLMSQLASTSGSCVLATELVSSTTVPGLVTMSPAELRRSVPVLLAGRNFFTGTHPGAIVRTLTAERTGSGHQAWVEPITPWLWRLSETRAYLAFAIAWGMRGERPPKTRDE